MALEVAKVDSNGRTGTGHGSALVRVALTALACQSDVFLLKSHETFCIAFRNPKTTRKDECVAVMQELATFVTR